MQLFDNITSIVRDDMAQTIKRGSKVSIAAACFSMYAYNELKEQLENIDELRFIFTSPTFTKEKAEKQKREFYIPRLSREQSLYGTEFEIRLRNEMKQKAVAHECAEWIRQKVRFKSNTTGENMVLSRDAEKDLKDYLKTLLSNKPENFANGREMRNLFETAIVNQANRLAEKKNELLDQELKEIISSDLALSN